jgi:hypothetical protein
MPGGFPPAGVVRGNPSKDEPVAAVQAQPVFDQLDDDLIRHETRRAA